MRQEYDRSWPLVKFSDMAQNVTDRVDPAEADGDVYVGLEHLDAESLKIRRWGTPADVIGQKLRFRKGDIIFGKRRAYQRKLAVAECDGICSAHAMVVRAKPKVVLPEFLPFLMQSDMFMERAVEISVGSLSPTINWKTLKVQEFPLPPLDGLRRIAEILWAADETGEGFRTGHDRAEVLRRVVVAHLMRGTAESAKKASPLGPVPKDWSVLRIGEAGDVLLGRQRAPKYQTGAHTRPYLRVANVFDGYLELSDVLEMDFDERDYQTFALRPKDILLNEGQSRELVGRCAMYRGEIPGCCFQNTLVRFRAGAALLPEFAFTYFQYAFYRGAFAAIASQTTSIAHLGAERFARLFMPVPPKDVQAAIVQQIEAVTRGRDELASHLVRVEQARTSLREQLLYGATRPGDGS